jgi:hypothetical protein
LKIDLVLRYFLALTKRAFQWRVFFLGTEILYNPVDKSYAFSGIFGMEDVRRSLLIRRQQIQATNSLLKEVRSSNLPAKELVVLRKHERRCRFGGEDNAVARQKIREYKESGLMTYRDLSNWYDCSTHTIERVVKRRGNYKRW